MPRLIALLLTTAALGLAGCGGGDDGGGGGGGGPTELTGTAKETFARTCGGCHALADAGTEGQVGPDLDELAPARAQVLTAISNGPGAMPENLLRGAAAEAVADYVAGAAGR